VKAQAVACLADKQIRTLL